MHRLGHRKKEISFYLNLKLNENKVRIFLSILNSMDDYGQHATMIHFCYLDEFFKKAPTNSWYSADI
jgi:hypothetical protein